MELKALAVWLVLLVAIVTLGTLRDELLEPAIGELRAHQIGTIAACAAAFGIIYALLPWVGPSSHLQAFGLGLLWLTLALVFELGVFHFAAGVPWSELLADCNLARGRLLVLLWLTVLLGPVIAFALRSRG